MSWYGQKTMHKVLSGVTSAALVFQPQLLVAEEQPTSPVTAVEQRQTTTDIALDDQGMLAGQVVDAQGAPVPNAPVSLKTGGQEVALVMSDDQGQFQVQGLQGGVYQITSAGHQGVYRLWTSQAAPPAATNALSIVSAPVEVVRGQYGNGYGNGYGTGNGHLASFGQWIAEHPIMTAGVVAAAIAIPLALADDDDPPATP
jgi:hypothetical protein